MDDYSGMLDQEYYDLFRYIRKVKIDTKMINKDYGKKACFILNYICPVIIKKGGIPLDVMAVECGFEESDEFYQFLMNYKPIYKEIEAIKEYYGVEE